MKTNVTLTRINAVKIQFAFETKNMRPTVNVKKAITNPKTKNV